MQSLCALAVLFAAAVLTIDVTINAAEAPKKDLFVELTYSGCYADTEHSPAIEGRKSLDPAGLSRDSCFNACSKRRYKLFGLRAGSECHCGNELLGKTKADAKQCGMPCPGDPTQLCGGPSAMAVYNTGSVKFFSKPTTEVTATAFFGCYRDDGAKPLLRDAVQEKNLAMTSAMCHDICNKKGLKMYGLKAGKICYCGTALPDDARLEADKCTSACMGDPGARCGGERHTEVYRILHIGNLDALNARHLAYEL